MANIEKATEKAAIRDRETAKYQRMPESYRRAVKEKLASIVGGDRISEDRQALEEFTEDHSPARAGMPELVVIPGTVEQITDIVKLANEMGFPLIPASSGPPHFHADTVAAGGEVILDLRGLNSIMWIDRRNRVAILEPGVTFNQLIPELEKEGLRTTMPLCPKADKSVLAAYMEREPLTMPRYQYDMSDPMCSSEFVLGYGDTYRTGESGMARADWKEQRDKWGMAAKTPYGRFFVDIKKICQGAQGSLGILAWSSIKCELLPEVDKLLFVEGESLDELTNAVYDLIHAGVADDIYIMDSVNLACLLRKMPAEIEGLRGGFPPWILAFTVGGFGPAPQDMFDYKMDILGETGIPTTDIVGGVEAGEAAALLVRRTSQEPYWKLRLRGDVRDLFFLTTISKTPFFVGMVQELAQKNGHPLADLGIYIQPMLQGNCCHLEFDFYFPPGENKKVEELVNESSRAAFAQGAFFSRPYAEWSDMVYGHYAQTHQIVGKLKDIFDPNGVLSPGRLSL